MKRLILIFTILGSISVLSYSQSAKTVTKSFAIEDFVFMGNSKGTDIVSATQYAAYDEDTLSPALPYIAVNVLLDPETTYDNFSYVTKDSLVFEEITINRCTPPHVTGSASTRNASLTQETSFSGIYPRVPVIFTGIQRLCGYQYASFVVSPFKYDAETGQLYLNTEVTISVEQKPSISQTKAMPQGRKLIEKIVHNKSDISTYVEHDRLTDYEYLVITCDSLKEIFQKLADWKTMKGVPAKILTMEEIDANYDDSTQQIKIKKAIKDYYDGQHSGLRYVLLGGCQDIVPAQICGVFYSKKTGSTPTDWFYGCLDVIDWNSDGNPLAGELTDSVDYCAEVVVSRMPASSRLEASNMVNRILEYERFPETKNWKNRMLLCGNNLHGYTENIYSDIPDSISDAQQYYHVYYLPTLSQVWDGEIIKFYDTGTDFDGDNNYNFTTENLLSQLQDGFNFVNIDTHGEKFYYTMEDSIGFTIEDASSFRNKGYTIITTSACFTNNFVNLNPWDAGGCLGEAFMKNPNGGILAYIGSSLEGWTPRSLVLHNELYRRLFTSSDHRLAPVLYDLKNEMAAFCSTNSVERWLLFSENMLGDPEMPVYIDCPKPFTDSTLVVEWNGEEFDISTEGNSGYNICGMSIRDRGLSYYERNSGSCGYADFEGELSVCVTKPGYIPYVAICGDNVKIQNEIAGGNFNIFSDDIRIGNRITNQKNYGPVKLINGKTLAKGASIRIENGFEVKKGASFVVEPQ